MDDVMDKPTTSPISTRKHGDVLIVLSNNPPVNALSTAVRQGLVDAIEQAEGDDSVHAVVIACEGNTFFAGADITEFGKPPQQPWLPAVVDRIEACTKPVVAAIHGTALGGGLEVALACHYRVAVPSAKLGTPEVKLGLLPGAGGTQRLPRVAGVRKALEMCSTGNPIGVKEAFDCGLIDRLIEDDLIPHAVGYAEEVRDVRPLPKSSERDYKINECDSSVFDDFLKENARKFRGFEAPLKNVEAVRFACSKPYAEGAIEERKLFMELMTGQQSAAQRYFFFAERKANKIEGLPENTEPRPIHRVGVIGAGTMGGGISMNFLSAGIPVTIVEMGQEALDRGTGLMRKNYEATASKGRMTGEQVEKAMGLLNPTLDFAALADCDLIIEAVYENMDVKKEVFGRLDKIAKPGAILASNTSYLNINEIAASISRPADVVGMHFFSPANVMKLLEVVRGDETAPDVLLTAMGIGKKIRKVPVVAGVCHGFIGNRMLMPRQIEATKLLLEGATPDRSTASMSSSECRWGRSRWPTSPVSTSAGTATQTASRMCATRCARSTAGARRRPRGSTIMTKSAGRHRRRSCSRLSRTSLRNRGSSGARSATRKSSSARSTQWSTRARRSLRRASPSARPTSMWCGSMDMAGQSTAAGRCSGRTARVSPRSSRA